MVYNRRRIKRLEDAIGFCQTRLDSISGIVDSINKEINEIKNLYSSETKELTNNINYLVNQIGLLKKDYENYNTQLKYLEAKLGERKEEKISFLDLVSEFLANPYRALFRRKKKKKVAPGYMRKWGIVIRIERWLDKFKAWWQRFWVPGYYKYKENIYHMHQRNRAWNDFTKKNVNPLMINYQALRDMREIGYTIIPFMLAQNEDYRRFIIEQIDTFIENVLLDMKSDTLGVLTGKGYNKEDIENVKRMEIPRLSFEERHDIVNHLIMGAIHGSANAMYVAATRRFQETYGNLIPEIGREMRREVYTDLLKNFFSSIYERYVFPIIHSYGQLIPKAEFTYVPPEVAKEEKEERKATSPLKLFGLAGALNPA
jgi:hypothetical protein